MKIFRPIVQTFRTARYYFEPITGRRFANVLAVVAVTIACVKWPFQQIGKLIRRIAGK